MFTNLNCTENKPKSRVIVFDLTSNGTLMFSCLQDWAQKSRFKYFLCSFRLKKKKNYYLYVMQLLTLSILYFFHYELTFNDTLTT